jgi:hypothetical protein
VSSRLATTLVSAAVLAVASFATTSAHAEETVKRYPPSSVRVKLVAGGLALTAVGWGAAFLTASQWPDVPGASSQKIPVIGPWIALGHSGCAPDKPDCGAQVGFRGVLLIVDALMQAGGLAIAGEGLFMTTEADAPKKAWVRPTPYFTPGGSGVGVVGQF